MNSREAIQELLIDLYIPTKDIRDINYDCMLIDIIQKELNMLDIIRKYIGVKQWSDNVFSIINVKQLNKKDYLKIKEWLDV